MQTDQDWFRWNYSLSIKSILKVLSRLSSLCCISSMCWVISMKATNWKMQAVPRTELWISFQEWIFQRQFCDCLLTKKDIYSAFLSLFFSTFFNPQTPIPLFPICWAKIKTRSRYVVVCSTVARVQRNGCLCFLRTRCTSRFFSLSFPCPTSCQAWAKSWLSAFQCHAKV